ncbi:MAG: hypothetical protein OES57_14465 [Acidimicrobiia bacterium]|nr:hypothetical protein [Acidimicrobiia bacterium]
MSRARRIVAIATVLVSTVGVTSAVAQTGDEPDRPPLDMAAVAAYLPEDRLSGGLELMELDGGVYEAALDELWEALVDRDRARDTIGSAQERLLELRTELDETTHERRVESRRRTSILDSMGEVADARAEVAVAEFMGVSPDDELGLRSLDPVLAADHQALPVHSDLAWELLAGQQSLLDERLRVTTDRLTALTRTLEELGADIAETSATLEQAQVTEFVRNSSIPQLGDRVVVTRWDTQVVDAQLPLVVVDAYVAAARRLGVEQPECGLEWWMLAGIGAVESGHGTWGGSTVDHNGDTDGTIIGLVLNGENGTALINDSDGGMLDGDAVYDRAVGPMQFIPSSWRFFGRDGNDDGVSDPHNLYDAALAAGLLLCRVDGSLSDGAGLRAALFSYNHHQAYVRAVVAAAAPFRPVVIPDPPPEPPPAVPDVGAYLASLQD